MMVKLLRLDVPTEHSGLIFTREALQPIVGLKVRIPVYKARHLNELIQENLEGYVKQFHFCAEYLAAEVSLERYFSPKRDWWTWEWAPVGEGVTFDGKTVSKYTIQSVVFWEKVASVVSSDPEEVLDWEEK